MSSKRTTQQYRELLPAAPSDKDGKDGRSSASSQPPPRALPPRHLKSATASCDRCREKKLACRGLRPCNRCTKQNVACVTTPSRPDANQLAALLASLTRQDSLDLLRSLQRTLGPATPSPSPSPPQAQTPAQNSLEFELINRHPIAYPALCPLSMASLPLKQLMRPTRLSRGYAEILSRAPTAELAQDASAMGMGAENQAAEPIRERRAGHPLLFRPLIDQRLARADLSKWTTVQIPNDLGIRAISLYFEIDYPTMPLFNADLFLNDFVEMETRFCSSLLVNSLLCWACLLYTGLNPDAAAFGVAFFHEGEMLWRKNESRDTITAMAAAQVLSFAATAYMKGDVGIGLLHGGIDIGKRLGMFEDMPGGSASIKPEFDDDEDWMKAASYTAWGCFNYISLHSLHYQKPHIKHPPNIPMPGNLDSSLATQRDQPLDLKSDPPVFHAMCQLWAIFHEILWGYHGGKSDEAPCIEFAERMYRRLLKWTSAIPLNLARGDQNSHAEVIMHMYFHIIVGDLFRPFLSQPSRSLRLTSFTSPQAIPEAIYSASVNQLKRLLVHFRLNFKLGALSILWMTSIIHVFNALVRKASTKNGAEWRFYFGLCLACLEDLYGSFLSPRVIVQGFLATALQHDAISFDDARRVVSELLDLGRFHTPATAASEKSPDTDASWIVDLNLATSDPEAAQAVKRAQCFEELLLMEEFTTGVVD